MRGRRGGVAQRLTRERSAAFSGDVPRPTPSPAQPFHEYSSIIRVGGRRDSDASSLCSSLPSSVGGPFSYSAASASSDPASYLRAVNSYLSSLSPPIYLKPPLPPGRDIADAFRCLLTRLDLVNPLSDLTRDLPPLLAALRCPIKLSKSALKAPTSPHSWPSVIFVLYWLVQVASDADHIFSSPSLLSENGILSYTTRAYSLFLEGNDSAIDELDAEYRGMVERHASSAVKGVEALEVEVIQAEAKLQELAAAPTRLEALETQHAALLEDVNKFRNVVDKFSEKNEKKKEKLAEREKELEMKLMENRKLDEENEALRQRIQGHALSTRDVERLTRELHAVEREISEGESRRNEMEEKAWQLDSEIERKLRENETLAEQCNQAIKKLKIGNNFQHVLNLKASSAAEVIGIDYKTLLKPALNALAEEVKKSKASKVEELINLQKQSYENDMILDRKKAHCTTIQTKINEIEARIDLLKKETENHALTCTSEVETIKENLAAKELEVSILERNAQDLLMNSEENLKRTATEFTKETELCAQELYALIDGVSKYKEAMSFMISGIKEEIKEITEEVKRTFEASIRNL